MFDFLNIPPMPQPPFQMPFQTSMPQMPFQMPPMPQFPFPGMGFMPGMNMDAEEDEEVMEFEMEDGDEAECPFKEHFPIIDMLKKFCPPKFDVTKLDVTKLPIDKLLSLDATPEQLDQLQKVLDKAFDWYLKQEQ